MQLRARCRKGADDEPQNQQAVQSAEVPGPTEHERLMWTFEETPTNGPAPEKKRTRAGSVKFEMWLKDNKAAIWNINKNKKVNYHFERFPNLRGARRGDQKGVRISYIGAAGTEGLRTLQE